MIDQAIRDADAAREARRSPNVVDFPMRFRPEPYTPPPPQRMLSFDYEPDEDDYYMPDWHIPVNDN